MILAKSPFADTGIVERIVMSGVRNSKLAVDFDLSRGIRLSGITDVSTGRSYLSPPSMLFEFVVDGAATQSDQLIIPPGGVSNSADQTTMTVQASRGEVGFYLEVGFYPFALLSSQATVATFALSVTNTSNDSISFRISLPKIHGISIAPGRLADMMGAIPQEAGSVMPLSGGTTLGMKFMCDVGLPFACNNMEVASIFDGAQGGGIFFCDLDGDQDKGVSPLQFNLCLKEVVASWTGTIQANSTAQLPRLGIGVHSTGDWHEAVDFYNSVHAPGRSFPATPAWFRDAGAIYCPACFGAGGIYLNFVPRNLAAGSVWITWENGDGVWRDGIYPNKLPLAVSPAGFAPPGAFLLSAEQIANQINVFAAGNDGAIWATWELGGGAWANNRNGLTPARITPQNLAIPGCPLACSQQGDNQLDVFFVDNDGAVTVTWLLGDGTWTDGVDGRPVPARITSPGFAPPGAHLATARQNKNQLDVFVISNDGAIWVLWVEGFGGWTQTPITLGQGFPPGAPLLAAWQNQTQLNVFAVSRYGTVLTVFEDNDSAWSPTLSAISPEGFAPAGAHLACAKQSDTQLDVFCVCEDGAIWVTWEDGDGAWTDGIDGRTPVPISATGLAPAGAPLAVAKQGSDQWDVFVVGNDGAIWVTWEKSNDAWTDTVVGKPGTPRPAQRISPLDIAPPAGGVTAIEQGASQVNVFCVGVGNLRSFLDLPDLLSDAKSLGTNIVYLSDYWEGTDQGSDPPYINKGDYQPRLDLGGEDAFIRGIAAVHQAGGRVILYVEPFIIYKYSQIAQLQGDAWAGRGVTGVEDATYPDNYTMVAPFPDWQNYIVSVAERLVGYGADGIYLDSYAWQMNRPMQCIGDNPGEYVYSAQEYAAGVLDLTGKMRTAIQGINPEAIVMGETTAGPIALRWDGGLDADFSAGGQWAGNAETLIASPVRYGIPQVHIFSNGRDLNGLQQMYAAGHGLALCNYWPGSFIFTFAGHIKKLVDIRTAYKDALIHGSQVNQPIAGNSQVVAYQYRGASHCILTVVTIGSQDLTTDIDLNAYDPGGWWQDLLTTDKFVPSGGILKNVTLSEDEGGIRVLLNLHRRIIDTQPIELMG